MVIIYKIWVQTCSEVNKLFLPKSYVEDKIIRLTYENSCILNRRLFSFLNFIAAKKFASGNSLRGIWLFLLPFFEWNFSGNSWKIFQIYFWKFRTLHTFNFKNYPNWRTWTMVVYIFLVFRSVLCRVIMRFRQTYRWTKPNRLKMIRIVFIYPNMYGILCRSFLYPSSPLR